MRLLIVLILTLPLGAQGSSRPARPVARPVVVTQLHTAIRIDGPMARVIHQITLSNPLPRPQQFDLIFPLGKGAVASGLDLRSGGQTLEGRVLQADDARAFWQSIVRRRRDPALLEHYGEALFRARVFPVPAKGTATVTLSYDHVVETQGDLMRMHVPLTAFRRPGQPLQAFSLKATVTAGHPITTLYSPTHDIGRTRLAELPGDPVRYQARLAIKKKQFNLDQDFLLFFKARGASKIVDITVLSEQLGPNAAGYFLAVINGIPTKGEDPEPRDMIFVLDRSGSMRGTKIDQAKASLKFLVERLRPQDRFNIVTYSNTVRIFGNGLLAPTPETLRDVLVFIEGIGAKGGTNIEGALGSALALFKEAERANQLIFLTDGLPTVGERNTRKLAKMASEKNPMKARVIAFGLGFDVNGAFLDRLAVKSRGLSEYILPSENIEERVPDFYARMQNPLLLDTEISIDMPGGRPHSIHDVYPKDVGDLYGGHQIILTGRYAKAGEARVTITGRRGRKPFRLEVPVTLAGDARQSSQGLVARIWAARKVGYLVDEIRLNGQSEELVKEIVRLGTRWGILTEYTSFLAAPETDLTAATLNLRRARDELGLKAGVESGTQGVAQAANSKGRQRAAYAETRNRFLDAAGRPIELRGCQNVWSKTFFFRKGGWIDSVIGNEVSPGNVVEVELYSDAFFALLDKHPTLNRCIARTGNVTVEIEGKAFRFKAP